ncbi:protein Lines homolog 1 isoform X2 [Scophthalmus maximus]|uniref:protein Lines homolog 1 isoform X2 n=1 Tax=Scophthalmus maximus TaxID=52904 RepID=UPI001FA827B6|nr:protein Lines homolog 1 isoform X2 [Scophthalmus maximus]
MAGLHGERFDRLTHAYRCFLAGSCPSQSAAEVAGVVFSGVRGPAELPGHDSACARAGARCREGSAELTCVSVTLVGIVTSLTSEGQPAELVRYCRDTLAVLFQDLDLMTQLVHHFQTEDQIISHLAAKSVSTYVVHHLLESICTNFQATVSPVWQQKCVQAFHSSSPGQELDGCLWSLTDVLKRLLQAAHQEILGKIVAAFEPSLRALCSKFLPEEKQRGMDFTSCDRWGTTFCLLLDLLEALAASSVICGAGLKSPRLVHIHSSALLTTISCSPEYFVKKRALLLLKRAVLQKAGEDWASGEVLSAGRRHEHFSTDMNKLAQTVLTAVAADWLQSVQVESASFFGGNKHSDGGQKPDCVMLRAVSLLILKSTELHIQAPGITGVDSAPDVYGYLQSLWGFLRQCSVHLMEVKHLCSWVSLLFGEQDDDMMEAAKASLFIFLHHRLCSGLDDIAESEAACVSGCNPHCHFLFLLQSVSFDHSILLDFLISSETCFLEYFVRYLKYLKADWQGFTAACERVTKSRCHVSLQESFTFSCAGDMPALTYTGEPDQVEFSSCVQPSGFIPPADRISLVAGLPLVEYDSSDESDAGSMEISEDEPGPSVCEKSKCPAFYVKQKTFEARQKQHESSDSAGLLSEPTSTVKRRPDGLSLPMLQSKQRLCTHMAPLSGQVTLARALTCLSELRQVVTRLQTKKLFPYNPSSLLKLMAHVENCSQQSPVSLFNK